MRNNHSSAEKRFKMEYDRLALEKNKFVRELERDGRMENLQQRRLQLD